MKKFALTAVAALLLLPAVTLAQSALVGTWKADLSNMQLPTKPTRALLSKGVYHCQTCVPAYSVKADGQDHAVSGHPYYDSVAVTVIGEEGDRCERDGGDGGGGVGREGHGGQVLA